MCLPLGKTVTLKAESKHSLMGDCDFAGRTCARRAAASSWWIGCSLSRQHSLFIVENRIGNLRVCPFHSAVDPPPREKSLSKADMCTGAFNQERHQRGWFGVEWEAPPQSACMSTLQDSTPGPPPACINSVQVDAPFLISLEFIPL